MPRRFRYPTSLGSWVSRLHESSAVVNSCFKSSTKLLKNLPRSTCNTIQAFAPVFGTGRLSIDVCPRANSDFVSTRTFVLFNNIISAVKYCLSSFGIKPNIEFGMGIHITGTEESTSHDPTFFCFFEDAGTFRFRQERGLSADRSPIIQKQLTSVKVHKLF